METDIFQGPLFTQPLIYLLLFSVIFEHKMFSPKAVNKVDTKSNLRAAANVALALTLSVTDCVHSQTLITVRAPTGYLHRLNVKALWAATNCVLKDLGIQDKKPDFLLIKCRS